MEPGLYEQLVTEGLERRLARIKDAEARTRPVDTADQPHVLARHIETAVHKALAATGDPERRLAIVNTLLSTLEDTSGTVTKPASQLLSVLPPVRPGYGCLRGCPAGHAVVGSCPADQQP